MGTSVCDPSFPQIRPRARRDPRRRRPQPQFESRPRSILFQERARFVFAMFLDRQTYLKLRPASFSLLLVMFESCFLLKLLGNESGIQLIVRLRMSCSVSYDCQPGYAYTDWTVANSTASFHLNFPKLSNKCRKRLPNTLATRCASVPEQLIQS